MYRNDFWLSVSAGRQRFGIDYSRDRCQRGGADGLIEGADVDAELCVIRDDVVFGARSHISDGHDGRFERRTFPRHYGLQALHDIRSHHDRVYGVLRPRPVPAPAKEPNLDGVRRGQQGTGLVCDGAGRKRAYMLPEHHRRHGKALEQPIGDHRHSALTEFLGRLEHGDGGTRPLGSELAEQMQRTDQCSGVHVMSAGVHHRHLHTVGIHCARHALVRKAGALLNRQRVKICAQHDNWPRSVADYGHDAGAADFRGDLKAQRGDSLLDLLCSAVLLERQLGVLVKVAIEVGELCAEAIRPALGQVGCHAQNSTTPSQFAPRLSATNARSRLERSLPATYGFPLPSLAAS